MSNLNALQKVVSRLEIAFDSETKAEIAELNSKITELTSSLLVKNNTHGDRLLAAMQADAANDADETKNQRETFNDVDYLSTSLDESVPCLDNAVEQNDWLYESVPQITDADLQLIFIKNLSEVLIQRMHSMDRFSEDDYAIGGGDLMPWDIVVGQRFADTGVEPEQDDQDEFAIVISKSTNLSCAECDHIGLLILHKADCDGEYSSVSEHCSIYYKTNQTFRAITESELPVFRAALEACYA